MLDRYARVTFDRALVAGQPQAELLAPGHPLLDAAVDVVLERFGPLLAQGAVLVDEAEAGTAPRLLVYLEHAIRDGRVAKSGEHRVLSQRLQFIHLGEDGRAADGGAAPYLDYRPITAEERKPDERFLRSVEEKIHVTESGKQSFRQEVVRKAMGAFKRGEKFTLDSHAQLHDAVEQFLFEQRRDVLRLVSSAARPDEELRQKISVVEQRLVSEYGYDPHSAREALNYVTTLLARE